MNVSPVLMLPFEWPLLICETLSFGLAFFALVIVPRTSGTGAAARYLQAIRYLALGALIWAPAVMLKQVAGMAGTRLYDAVSLVPEALAGTHIGRMWVWRFAALAAFTIAAWVPNPARKKAFALTLIVGGLFLLRALSSHAIDKGSAAVAIYLLHELAASTWLGCLAGLFGASLGKDLTAGTDADLFIAAAPKVSRYAGWCVATLVASGSFTAFQALEPHVMNLIYSSYGRTLLLKLAIASVAILTGGYNRWRLLGQLDHADARITLRNNLAIETVVLAVVLGCSVVLASTPPAH